MHNFISMFIHIFSSYKYTTYFIPHFSSAPPYYFLMGEDVISGGINQKEPGFVLGGGEKPPERLYGRSNRESLDN